MMNSSENKSLNLTFNTLTVLALFLISAFFHSAQAQSEVQKNETYKFVNGNWFNGKTFDNQVFYSVGGILTHRRPAKIDEVVDLENKFVIPPFAEAHTHQLDNPSKLAEQESIFLKEGVMYAMVLNNGASNALVNRPLLNKPGTLDVLYANGGITRTGQHPAFAYERIASGIAEWYQPENTKIIQAARKEENNSYWFFDTVEDVDKKWNAYIASRPDIVKIYLLDAKTNQAAGKSLSEAVAAYVTKKAHAAGLRVAAHIETSDDMKIGLKIGVDFFAHSPYYGYDFNNMKPAPPIFTPAELKTIRRRKIAVIPTLSLNEEFSIVRNAGNNYRGEFDPARFNKVVEFQKKTVAALKNAGFIFAIGSDRQSLTPEIDYWAKNGIFEPSFILKTLTETTPRMMYPKRKIGALKDGYEASFIVLDGSPLTDFNQVKNINFRFKQGKIISLPN